MIAHFHVVNFDGSTTPRAVDPDHVLAIAPGRPIESRHGAPEQPTVAVLVDGSGLDSVSRLSGWVRALGDFLSDTGAAEELHRVGWKSETGLVADDSVPSNTVDTRDGGNDVVEVCVSRSAQVSAARSYLGNVSRTYTLGDASVEIVTDESVPAGAFGSVL